MSLIGQEWIGGESQPFHDSLQGMQHKERIKEAEDYCEVESYLSCMFLDGLNIFFLMLSPVEGIYHLDSIAQGDMTDINPRIDFFTAVGFDVCLCLFLGKRDIWLRQSFGDFLGGEVKDCVRGNRTRCADC